MDKDRMECNIEMNSSKAFRPSAMVSCLCRPEWDRDDDWGSLCRMCPQLEESKHKTIPVVKAALTVFTEWPKPSRNLFRRHKWPAWMKPGYWCVVYSPVRFSTSEVLDGIASPLDCKGLWQQEYPHLWNTLEVNNQALISPITSIRGVAQYQAALLGIWEDLVVKLMCLQSAWKMPVWKYGNDGLEAGHFRIRKMQEWKT